MTVLIVQLEQFRMRPHIRAVKRDVYWNVPDDPASNIFRLASSSALIDKGENSYVPEVLAKDIDGESRISGTKVDLGAFEYQK